MRKILLAIILTPSLYANVLLKTEIQCGEKSYQPSISVAEGEWADISQDEILLRLNAKGHGDAAVVVKTEIARIRGTEIEVLGTPSFKTKWDEAAELEAREEDGSLRYRLKVTPSLVALKGVPDVQDKSDTFLINRDVGSNDETTIPNQPSAPPSGSVPPTDVERKD